MKDLCDCGKVATWCYMPGYSSGKNPNYCDNCVPRGCECCHRYVDPNSYHPPLDNLDMPSEEDKPYIWIEEGKIWAHVDEKGRLFPCCEYIYDEDGWDDEL